MYHRPYKEHVQKIGNKSVFCHLSLRHPCVSLRPSIIFIGISQLIFNINNCLIRLIAKCLLDCQLIIELSLVKDL